MKARQYKTAVKGKQSFLYIKTCACYQIHANNGVGVYLKHKENYCRLFFYYYYYIYLYTHKREHPIVSNVSTSQGFKNLDFYVFVIIHIHGTYVASCLVVPHNVLIC